MTEPPTFSIIIPTCNRTAGLDACLGAITALDYPRNRLEVIVVDDGSRACIRPGDGVLPEEISIKILKQENAGPAKARNHGAKVARGEFLAFTDDDCMPDREWLRALSKQLQKTPDCAAGGRTINALAENPWAAASQLLVDYLYEYYNQNPARSTLLTSNNLAVERRCFIEMGGFDESFPVAGGEDREFCAQWTHKGYGLIHVPGARVYHRHGMSLTAFWRQHFRYGRGAYRFHRRAISLRKNRVRFEPVFFYCRLLGFPLKKARLNPGSRRLQITALFVLSQMANVAGYISAWVEA